MKKGAFKIAVQKRGKAFFAKISLEIRLKEDVYLEKPEFELHLPEAPPTHSILEQLDENKKYESSINELHEAIQKGIKDAVGALNHRNLFVNEFPEITVTEFEWNPVDTKPQCAYYVSYWAMMSALGFDSKAIEGPHFDDEKFDFDFKL